MTTAEALKIVQEFIEESRQRRQVLARNGLERRHDESLERLAEVVEWLVKLMPSGLSAYPDVDFSPRIPVIVGMIPQSAPPVPSKDVPKGPQC
jgi:hypothetical protein